MKNLKRMIVACCAVVMLSGCDGPQEQVRIVHVQHTDETGEPDEYTVVEFPDGTRRFKFRKWGEVGDEFTACKTNGGWR